MHYLEGVKYASISETSRETGIDEGKIRELRENRKIPGRKIEGFPGLWFSDADIQTIKGRKPELNLEEKREGIAKVRKLLKKESSDKLLKKNIRIRPADEQAYKCALDIAKIQGITIGDLLLKTVKPYIKEKAEHLKALRT